MAGVLAKKALSPVAAARYGIRLLFPRLEGRVATYIEHGSIRPVAIEAQHGDGMDRALHPFRRGKLLGVEVALHISAGRIRFIQPGFLGLGECQFHLDLCLAASGQGHNTGVQRPQEQICVIAGHSAVTIQVPMWLVGNLRPLANHIIQQSLHIIGIDQGIPVKIHVSHVFHRGQCLAVHRPFHICLQHRGAGVHVQDLILACKQILGKQVGRQGEWLFCIRQIVERKREAIDAFPRRVVAQLRFDLTIGIGDGGILIHPDVGLGRNGFVDIGQASALLQDGPILPVGGLLPKGHPPWTSRGSG